VIKTFHLSPNQKDVRQSDNVIHGQDIEHFLITLKIQALDSPRPLAHVFIHSVMQTSHRFPALWPAGARTVGHQDISIPILLKFSNLGN
jgi:hypothetical protein